MRFFRKRSNNTVRKTAVYADAIDSMVSNYSTALDMVRNGEMNERLLLEHITNAIREQDKRLNDVDRGIDEITGPDYRTTSITDWLNAMRAADQPWEGGYRSNWVKLFDIFLNMIQDAHVQAVVDTLKERVKSKDFYICDKNGEKLDEVTAFFEDKWFYDSIDCIADARLWGFSLIQFDKKDGHLTARGVNKKHIRPDLGGIVKQQYDNTVYKSWDKAPFKNWTVYIYERNLGRLNAAARWYIYKTEISRFWAKFNQLYGVPPIVAKTKTTDTGRKGNMINMLKKWVTSRWMVIDEADEVTQFNGNLSGSGQQFFENLIRLADEQISKAILGSTMVLDNGSSRSQSEVHESNTKTFENSLARLVKFVTDKEIIPRLNKLGFDVPTDCKLVWDNSEKLTMKERAEVLNTISNNFEVEVSVASEFLGLELKEKEEPTEQQNPFEPTQEEMKDIYNRRFDGKD